MKVLFVCSANVDRSPTAEKVIHEKYPDIETKSAGVHSMQACVNKEPLQWADVILCMEYWHKQLIQREYQESISGKAIYCLDIPDEYSYMESYLIEEINSKFDKWLNKYQSGKRDNYGNFNNKLE